MNALETLAVRAWRDWGSSWVFFGQCSHCHRTHDDEGRPLLVRGPRRGRVLCLECFDEVQR